MDFSQLPDDVREKLAELELELSEGKQEKELIKKLFFGERLSNSNELNS